MHGRARPERRVGKRRSRLRSDRGRFNTRQIARRSPVGPKYLRQALPTEPQTNLRSQQFGAVARLWQRRRGGLVKFAGRLPPRPGLRKRASSDNRSALAGASAAGRDWRSSSRSAGAATGRDDPRTRQEFLQYVRGGQPPTVSRVVSPELRNKLSATRYSTGRPAVLLLGATVTGGSPDLAQPQGRRAKGQTRKAGE
jgi:hypothetical protein